MRYIFFALLFCGSLFGKEQVADFLIVGAQKSGTTALQYYLSLHPSIAATDEETHFFDENFNKGLQWYKNHLRKRANKSDLVCDKSPFYLLHPLVPERVYSTYPKMKIIAILRNPIDRAYSQYWHNKRYEKRYNDQREELSFEAAIEAEPRRLKGELERLIKHPNYNSQSFRHHSYLTRGIYADQIKRWFKYFPKEQVLIISSTDLRDHLEQTLRKVCDFLGVEPLRSYKATYVTKHAPYPPMDPKTRKKLIDFYRPHNEELEKLLGVKFNWD